MGGGEKVLLHGLTIYHFGFWIYDLRFSQLSHFKEETDYDLQFTSYELLLTIHTSTSLSTSNTQNRFQALCKRIRERLELLNSKWIVTIDRLTP